MEFFGSNAWKIDEDKYFAQGGISLVYKAKSEDEEQDFVLKLYKFYHFSGERYKRFLAGILSLTIWLVLKGVFLLLIMVFMRKSLFYVMPYFPNGTIRDKYFGGNSCSEKDKIEDFLKLGRLKNEVEHQRSKWTGGGRWAGITVS